MRDRDLMVPGKSVALAENGMAATSHPQATLAAVEILKSGEVLDRGLDIQAASDQTRSFFSDGAIALETTIPDDVRLGLEARGHRTRRADEPLGGCQVIWIDHERGVLWGASDHRKDGIALGY